MAYDFNQILAQLHKRPDVEEQGPSTVQGIIPMVGQITTVVTQMTRENQFDDEDKITGAEFTLFLQTIQETPNGPQAVQVVIPDKAVRRIVAQYERLNSRTRPFAKRRASDRAKANPRGIAKPAVDVSDDQCLCEHYGDDHEDVDEGVGMGPCMKPVMDGRAVCGCDGFQPIQAAAS